MTPRTPRQPPNDVSPEATQPASALALRRFRLVFSAVRAHFHEVESITGVPGAQLWAMSVIHAHPGLGMNALAAHMDIHQSTASNLVRALVKAGHVRQERQGEDKRAVQLHLEASARKILHTAPGPHSGVLPDALARLDDKTLKQLNRNLEQLLRHLDVNPASGQIPLGQNRWPQA